MVQSAGGEVLIKFFGFIFQWGRRETIVELRTPSSQILVLIPFSNKKNQGSLKK
jgi:hypothetical protein